MNPPVVLEIRREFVGAESAVVNRTRGRVLSGIDRGLSIEPRTVVRISKQNVICGIDKLHGGPKVESPPNHCVKESALSYRKAPLRSSLLPSRWSTFAV